MGVKENGSKSVVEQSNLEEEIYVLANLYAAEEHYIESAKKTGDSNYIGLCDKVRMVRQAAGGLTFPPISDTDGERTVKGESWCALKHMMVSKIHIMEIIEKLARKGDTQAVGKWFEVLKANDTILYSAAKMFLGGNVKVVFGVGDDGSS